MIFKTSKLPNTDEVESIFFVGVKGVGTMPLSLIAKEAGLLVAGSDIDEEFITDKYLKTSGIKVFKGFEPNDIHDFFSGKDVKRCLVVTTGAHKGFENPQVKWAIDNDFHVVTQGQALGIFMDGDIFGRKFKSIAVAASHGKTTISSLLTTTLNGLGFDPTFTVGTGEIYPFGQPGHYGKSEFFVAEADEYVSEPTYDKVPKFLYLNPNFAIFNNIDFDHPDFYSGIDDIKNAFLELSDNIKSGGILILNGDDKYLQELRPQIEKDIRIVSYGKDSKNDYVISKIVTYGLGSKFTVSKRDKEIGVFELSIPGIHNALNSLSVISLLLELGFDPSKIRSQLSVFSGTKRRLEKLGLSKNGALIIDDYGHHPAEIKATISSLIHAFPNKELICVFQPHTFSRTKALLLEFASAFSGVSKLLLLPIFRSQRDFGFDNSDQIHELVKKCLENVDTKYIESKDDMVEYLNQNYNAEKYIILTIGAGDVYKIGQALVENE